MSHPVETGAANPAQGGIIRAGSGITSAPDGVATGSFLVQMMLSGKSDGEMTAMRAFMEPGVITHWHSHPLGQLLFVLDGVGRFQRDGGEPAEIHPGDCVWFAPHERHWHGADRTSPFSYLSVQQIQDGTAVRWLELQVSLQGA